ncbi:UDP-glucose--hexose-1-phosphate uridylyltransferase [Psychroflexus sp. YR1-1]|uniref:Galactose-1-phosphate uridylyltransferase n=1 Tax=Psychroflexus aurantiacus TaxID=2709310 RepID=A0A6B3R2V1_9FLAO|nr:UDP-glucose--hexose-1-phosphate uridylyltransferase [Psychroflexus aurantiacus]NEV93820.1 UDP-glucose--hexose-1-phosphate uridylyltransferase [Psychroflexus aurantiacus]
MQKFNSNQHPHRRYNPLLDEWILVSPQRTKRPWQGQEEEQNKGQRPEYDETCYLCPGNTRSSGSKNPVYEGCYVFENDFPSLIKDELVVDDKLTSDLFQSKPERGINKVVCFSPKHNLTIPEMELEDIEAIVRTWKAEYIELGSHDFIKYVQIFENKGAVMGCSNPHPHGQIWSQSSIPSKVKKTQENLEDYHKKTGRSLLKVYLEEELLHGERIVAENEHFAVLVPFWATWPYETLIISKRHFGSLSSMKPEEEKAFAEVLKAITVKYDNLFNISFPYSSGIHQAPTDGMDHPEWHFHMHFYPPLLRSATVKKFMVGYEMLGEAQRDISAEQAAKILRELPAVHYKSSN